MSARARAAPAHVHACLVFFFKSDSFVIRQHTNIGFRILTSEDMVGVGCMPWPGDAVACFAVGVASISDSARLSASPVVSRRAVSGGDIG